jgi:hypothetical protein
MVHFAPTHKTADAPEVAAIFMDTVYKLHGMPESLVTDRDSKFTSEFWRAFATRAGMMLKMSSAYHPETDGQTERANKTLEQILRAYVSPRQDDWDEYLAMAEFACNNAVNASTGYTPFHLNNGMSPRTSLDIALGLPAPVGMDPLKEREEALADAKRSLQEAQARQKRYADEHRQEREFAIGTKVLLSTENLRINERLSNKFKPRWTGPFIIKRKIGTVAYELDLPPEMKIHPVFHVSKLKKHEEDTEHPAHRADAPPGPIYEDDDQYEVEALVGKKTTNGVTKYRVRWKGYSHHSDLWVPRESIEDSLIEEYEAKEEEKAKLKRERAARIKAAKGQQKRQYRRS